MKKLILLYLLLMTVNSFGQDYFQWRIAHERWVGEDKLIHVTGSYLLCAGLDTQFKLRHAMLISNLFCLAWEIKDTCIPYEKAGDWGGKGFSYSDYMIGNLGILLYAGSSYIYSKHIKAKQKIPPELKITYVELNP